MLSKLATSAPSKLYKKTFFEILEKSVVEFAPVLQVNPEPRWINPIAWYLGEGVLRADHKQAQKIRY